MLPALIVALALGAQAEPSQALQSPVASQAAVQPAPARLRVFLDCDCFGDYMRSELTFVDYVRTRESADVHVLGQSRETGGGGREYALNFVGAGRLAGVDLDLRAVTTASDTEDTRRRAVASRMTLGLLSYIARADLPAALVIAVEEPEDTAPVPGDDPWNFWTYTARASAELQAEESSREVQWNVRASADRITEDWKLTAGAFVEHSTEKFDLDEDDPITSRRHRRELDWLVAKSFGEHWSVGTIGEVRSSSFDNTEFSAGAAPTVEYNVFPYSAYQRRQLRLQYYLGALHAKYYEVTLFDKTAETLVQHALSATFDRREPWGTLEARVQLQQYLPDTELYRLEMNGETSIRIARGLSLSLEVGASRIRDQVSLPKRGATPEEVLLRQRRLRSGYEYSFDIGVSYTFGSIFNNIVNPRFGS